MAILNEIIQFYEAHAFLADIAIAAAATLFLFVFLRKRAELSAHAFQNTLTTLFVLAFNVVILICFLRDVDDSLQAAYDALGIPTLDRAFWDGVPFFVTCLIGIAAKDFADYWNHRFMHTSWGWPTHAAHHSDTHVNGFTSFRIHFLESLVMSVSYILLLTWLQIPAAIPALLLLAVNALLVQHQRADRMRRRIGPEGQRHGQPSQQHGDGTQLSGSHVAPPCVARPYLQTKPGWPPQLASRAKRIPLNCHRASG